MSTINPLNGDNMANGASPYFVNYHVDIILVLITPGARVVGRCHDIENYNTILRMSQW
jgi:N-acyl-D-aspartate/D-glutamate deacylase